MSGFASYRPPTSLESDAGCLRAVEQPCAVRDTSVKTVKVGEQTLMVKKMSSGFRVLYEPGIDSNTIVSVLTPREVGLLKG